MEAVPGISLEVLRAYLSSAVNISLTLRRPCNVLALKADFVRSVFSSVIDISSRAIQHKLALEDEEFPIIIVGAMKDRCWDCCSLGMLQSL